MSPSSPLNTNSTSPFPATDITTKPAKMKRCFDVAFLMKPDDLSKKRQKFALKQQLQYYSSGNTVSRYSPSHENTVEPNGEVVNGFRKHCDKDEEENPVVNRETDPGDDQYLDYSPNEPFSFTRSAFTKFDGSPSLLDIPPVLRSPSSVSTLSGGVSPDSCQDSLSPPLYLKNKSRSPISFMHLPKPIQFYNRIHNNTSLPYFVNSLANPYASPYIINDKDKSTEELTDPQRNNLSKSPVEESEKAKLKSSSDYMIFPGNSISPYVPCPFPPSAAVPLLTTAGSVGASLLPSSFAALTLPAQNVCAKCNVSFRMTSDLVYHMRSHHKADSIVQQNSKRRKDQDKLKCPVCNESFRERHHLTRHMTAHQDKDGDDTIEEEVMETTKRKHPMSNSNAK